MINRNKAIIGFIAVGVCTSVLSSSIIPALGIDINGDTSLNSNLSEESNLDNSSIVENLTTSTTGTAVTISTTEEAVAISIDTAVLSDYVTIQQTDNGTVKLDEASSNKEIGYYKYIIKPDSGYEIKDVIVDGQSKGAHTYYEFENLTESGHTISAVFREIGKHATGYIPEFVDIPYVYNPDVNNNLPSAFGLDQASITDTSYNTSTKDYISSVKDQGQLGVCWTFSALGTLESSLLKKYNYATDLDKYDFSENHMRYALSSDGGNTLGFDRTNDYGGNFDMALAYLTRGQMNGAVNESDDPYPVDTTSTTAAAVRSLSDISKKSVQDYYPTQVIRLGNLPSNPTDTEKKARKDEMKNLIQTYGSVTLSYESDESDESYYNEAANGTEAYYDPNATTGNTNHAVCIIGWDDNYSVDNFKTGYKPAKNGAFLVKNSWGQSWGQNGYFYISYEDPNAFSGINAFKEIKNRDFFENIYEYDTFGKSLTRGYTNLHDDYYANVFNTKKSGLEKLSAISTYCNYPNSYIKLYVSIDGGKTFSEKTSSSGYTYDTSKGYKIDDAGYYTFMLDNSIELNSDKFAVAIEVQQADNTLLIPLENNTYQTYSSKAVVEKGSYMGTSLNNLMSNITNNTYSSYNTCIKAFTENIVVDKTALSNAITAANANKNTAIVSTNGADVEPTNKWVTSAAITAYTNAIAIAQDVANNASATQTVINNAVTALQSATTTFDNGKALGEKGIVADKTALQNLYDTHKTDTVGNYTSGSWSTFTIALNNASTVLANANATQGEVNTAKSNLEAAISGLVIKSSSSTGGSSGSGGSGGGGGGSSSTTTEATTTSTTETSLTSTAETIRSQVITNINTVLGEGIIVGQAKEVVVPDGNKLTVTSIIKDGKIAGAIITAESSSAAVTIPVKTEEGTVTAVYKYVPFVDKYIQLTDGVTIGADTITLPMQANATYVTVIEPMALTETVTAGWAKVRDGWYLLNATGDSQIGWQKDSVGWVYLSPSNGVMQTGWNNDKGTWYYLKDSGYMATGWIKVGSAWYYLNGNGSMAYNTKVDGYTLGSNGAWVS